VKSIKASGAHEARNGFRAALDQNSPKPLCGKNLEYLQWINPPIDCGYWNKLNLRYGIDVHPVPYHPDFPNAVILPYQGLMR
jgi:hypothetical protein